MVIRRIPLPAEMKALFVAAIVASFSAAWFLITGGERVARIV